MQDDDLTPEEIKFIWNVVQKWGLRALRGLSYALVTYILAALNTYGVGSVFWLSVAVGVLGVGSVTARLGQIGIALLLLMAVMPMAALSSILHLL